MFVCICRAVTLSRVTAVVETGAANVDAVEAACGAGGDCGSCRSEIASIIAWLASEEGGYATGADFSVNGGLHMG